MIIDRLLDKMKINSNQDAIIWKDRAYSYGWLLNAIKGWNEYLNHHQILAGNIVSLQADFSPMAIALLIALLERKCIVALIATVVQEKIQEYNAIAKPNFIFSINNDGLVDCKKLTAIQDNDLIKEFQLNNKPGLIIFSSGSTGKSKAVLHDAHKLLDKFIQPKKKVRVIAFLLFDHIGGINTLFYTLFNHGCVIIPKDRSPARVCFAIEKNRAQALTTSPTFLNLLLLSECYQQYDLSSLEVINYSTEVMPETTLQKLNALFPHVRFSQAYGLSEVGVLPVRSPASNSLLLKIDNNTMQSRIRNGLLEIKSSSSMLGYLNYPSPFTEDGWFITGDAVIQEGEYLRVLGRQSEMINVGGQKVYPAEIEGVIQEMEGVKDIVICGEANPITGQMVVARVNLGTEETISEFRTRLWQFCKVKLPAYKIPQKITFLNSVSYGERFKKMRLTN